MKVKELITELLDMPMDADVLVSLDDPHKDDNGNLVTGYMFDIDRIREFNSNMIEITFTDWRKIIGNSPKEEQNAGNN